MPAIIKINPAPSHRHEVPERMPPTAEVEDAIGAGIRVEIRTGVGVSGVCISGVLSAGAEMDEGLGATGMGLRLTIGDGVDVGMADSVAKGVSPPASMVEVGEEVAGLVSVAVAGAGDEVFVGWVV